MIARLKQPPRPPNAGMLESLREETKGKLQMLLSLRKNGLTSLSKEVKVVKVFIQVLGPPEGDMRSTIRISGERMSALTLAFSDP